MKTTKPKHSNPRQKEYKMRFNRTIHIEKPRRELYAYWRNLENLPNFIHHLESVRRVTDKVSHWTVVGPFQARFEWDAEIVTDKPGEVLSWQSLDSSQVANAGSVRFDESGSGTDLKVEIAYDPPAGRPGAAIAQIFGENPSQELGHDLEEFKRMMEFRG